MFSDLHLEYNKHIVLTHTRGIDYYDDAKKIKDV